jgi:hypothetical protein
VVGLGREREKYEQRNYIKEKDHILGVNNKYPQDFIRNRVVYLVSGVDY